MPRYRHFPHLLACRPACLVLALLLLGVGPACAGRFLTLTEAETFAVGAGEAVSAGYQVRQGSGDNHVRTTSFQLGFEFGVAPGLQLGMALPAYTNLRGPDASDTQVSGTALWGVYSLRAPSPKRLGVSLAAAVSEGNDGLGSDVGLVLEEVRLPVVAVLNLGFTAFSPQNEPGTTTAFVTRLGLSRPLGHGLSAAVESDWDFGAAEGHAGPAVLWDGARCWLLAGVQFELHHHSRQRGPGLHLQVGVPY